MADLLTAKRVTKRFGGLVAVNGVDFTIQEKAIVSLIGPNGAGKTKGALRSVNAERGAGEERVS